MIAFLRQRWFLFTLLIALYLGIAWPRWMLPLTRYLSGDLIVAVVTFIMAVALDSRALWAAMRRPGAAGLASGLNSGLAPVLGWLASFPLPPELGAGVILASSVPCTLATAAVWTRRAGGNDAVAFLVTMITSLASFIVVPTWLLLLIGVWADVDFFSIAFGLVLLVVLPIVTAQMARRAAIVRHWADQRKSLLSTGAQLGVLLMVLVGAVSSGVQIDEMPEDSILSFKNVLILVAAVTLVHCVLLLLGLGISRMLRYSPEDAIAVGFSGSQKTLMVGAYVALAVGPLAILAMVAYHAAQLVIDTLVADWWRENRSTAQTSKPIDN